MMSSESTENQFGDGAGLGDGPSDLFGGEDSRPAAAWRAEVASRVHHYRARHGEADGEDATRAISHAPNSYPVPSITECTSPPVERVTYGECDESGMYPGELSERTLQRLEEIRNAAHSAFDTNYYRRLNLETLSAMAEETAAKAAQLAVNLDVRPASDGDAFLDRYYIAAEEASRQLAELGEEYELDSADIPESAGSRPEEQGNLIVFPRPLLEPPLMRQPERDELAEPVAQRPRILEVPEDIMPAVQGSLFPEIRLDGDDSDAEAAGDGEWKARLPVAPLAFRLQAALLDATLVAGAGAMFTAFAWRALPNIPHTRPFWTAMAAVGVVLWVFYQQLFLLCGARTPGMWLRGIRLTNLDGSTPHWRQRRTRALFLLVSTGTGMLGNLWALFDRNTLCWHDRLSQSFPTMEPLE
jgi:uncharacterized RDD family membrane protein YckC